MKCLKSAAMLFTKQISIAQIRNFKWSTMQGCYKVWNSGGAHIKPLLKKWWGTMLSNHQKVVGHVPTGPTYGDTPVCILVAQRAAKLQVV